MRDKRITFFIVGYLLALLISVIGCERKDRFGQPDTNDRVQVDTVYVDRIVEVPGLAGTFTDSIPEPRIIYRADPELLADYESLESENDRLKAYIEAITIRSYEKTYVSRDSIVKITVNDSVTGTLDFQSVAFDIAPREVKIQEKIITKTIEKYPDFSLSLGAGIKVPTQPNGAFSFEGVLGIKGKKGFEYHIGFDTKKEVRFTLTKDIFIKF